MPLNKSYFVLILFAFSAITGWLGCTARRVPKGEVMLKKVIIRCDDPKVSKDEVYDYLKQKPNRKLLGVNNPHLFKRKKLGYSVWNKHFLSNGAGYPFYLAIHNIVNPTRAAKKTLKRNEHYKKRLEHYRLHPKTKKGVEKRMPRRHRTVGEFLLDIGEAPVILDTAQTARSLHQVTEYLHNKGYFNGTVRDTVFYPPLQKGRKKKVIQGFIVTPGQPYTINAVTWEIYDTGISYDLQSDTAAKDCLIKPGEVFDQDNFENERDRITRSLRNNGYYKFSKEYIRFSVDSSLGTHQVNVRIIIRKQENQVNDSTWVESNHQRYTIRNIYVKSLIDLSQIRDEKDVSQYDTTYFREIAFLRNMGSKDGFPIEELLKFKPEVLSQRIAFQTRTLYRQIDYEATYRQLTSLRVFRQVVIDPKEVDGDKLDIYIKLIPVSKQNFITQLEGTTNSGSSLGIGGSFGLENTNVARGAEILKFSVKGGTEIQQTINGTTPEVNGLNFNTIQAGFESSLNIPREFFPFNYLVPKNKLPEKRITEDRRTVFLASFNYQRRVDYDRSLANLSYGYTFRIRRLATTEKRERDFGRIAFFPIELNVVKVKPRQGLIDLLQNPDPLLHYRFTDHLIRDFRITYVLNTQDSKKGGSIFFLKVDAESSGLLLRPLFELSNAELNEDGSYEIAGIPFSHYLRFFVDGRYNQSIGTHQNVVMRAAIGLGFPLCNFPTLPLEKSFYGGGANGIRAWEARTLGPGSYIVPDDQKYAQFGDIQLEYNIEYRFRITKTLFGAVFLDGGNIWILKEDSLRPGADFSFKNFRFLQDLAAGPGVGVRYDLSFFIIRLDWGFKLRDPSYPYGERWYIPGERKLGSNLNFGIGYPF
ncbi:MAG: outer membrane protein assembly factor [Bacteroidota bacterium]|nr:outer membrane protein assembly factor [Bacteroidota bacterium]